LGKKKKSKSAPVPAPPQNYYFYGPDRSIIGEQVYDKSKGGYVSKTYESPQQQMQRAQLGQLFTTNVQKLNDPKALQQGTKAAQDAFYASSVSPIMEDYNKARQLAIQNFGARGMLDSAGFSNYLANELEKVRQQGLSQAAQDAQIYGQNAANQNINQTMQLLQLAGGGQADANAGLMNNMQLGQSGMAQANNVSQNQYQMQLQRAQQQLSQQMANQSNRGGFLGLF